MLNFKQFLSNAGAFLSNNQTTDRFSGAMSLPDITTDLPTTSMEQPSRIHRIKRVGRVYEIHGDRNLIWNCPAQHYEHLQMIGKAPHIGDQVKLVFYKNGSVKSFEVIN